MRKPQLGDVVKGAELGYKSGWNKYIWAACEECANERWVWILRGGPVSKRCRNCKDKENGHNHSGPSNARWQGGKKDTVRGYVVIWAKDHPGANKTGYVYEHRLIWEQVHSTELPPGWIVHHLNGIRNDNRPLNLVAMPSRKHKGLLEEKAQRIRKLELEVKRLTKIINGEQ